jgi:hypothetical protein
MQDQLQNIALAVNGQYDLAYVPTALNNTDSTLLRSRFPNPGFASGRGPDISMPRRENEMERVAHRSAYFAFLGGFSSCVRVNKQMNAVRIWEEPRRNANYAYLLATVTSGPSALCLVLGPVLSLGNDAFNDE